MILYQCKCAHAVLVHASLAKTMDNIYCQKCKSKHKRLAVIHPYGDELPIAVIASMDNAPKIIDKIVDRKKIKILLDKADHYF